MARGWESKAVEAQLDDAAAKPGPRAAEQMSPAQAERLRKKEGLKLSRLRVAHDLAGATNPRYRQMLTAALAHLDRQLAELD
jgi:hypothetical protein